MRKKVHYLKKTLLMLLVALQVFGGLFPAGTLRKEASRPVQTAAAESAVPYSGTNNLDGSKIEGISVTWLTQDSTVTADGDPVSQEELADRPHLFVSTTSNKELSLVYKLEVELSGQYDYAPGDIIITLPAQVWHGRKYEETGEPGITAGVVDESVLLGGMELTGALLESSYALLENSSCMYRPLQDDMKRAARETWLLDCVPAVAEGSMSPEECWATVMALDAFEQ